MISWQINNLEKDGIWTPQQGADISKTLPDFFTVEKLETSLIVVCAGKQYAGALAKCESPLIYPSTNISFSTNILFSEDIQYAQAIEIDTKITDINGWTYDGSYRFFVPTWMIQTQNPWVDTGVVNQLKLDVWNTVTVMYTLDYVNHTISISGAAPIAAKQLGWQKTDIVTQLQLGTSKAGVYSVRFNQIGYKGF